jgi:hypothetical protein
VADLTWREAAHIVGEECNITAPRLRRAGARCARVWMSKADGTWRWCVLEWDSDSPCADLAAGKAAVQRLNDDAIRDGDVSTYKDTRGVTHHAPMPYAHLQERVQAPIDELDHRFSEESRNSGW